MYPQEQMEDEENPMKRILKGAAVGVVPGVLWGAVAAANVGVCGPIPTLTMIGKHGLGCAATGGLWVGVEILAEKQRRKRDVHNKQIGGFVAGFLFAALRKKDITLVLSEALMFANVAGFLPRSPSPRKKPIPLISSLKRSCLEQLLLILK